jgi:curved DNA-binding protein CbpA
MSATNQFSQIRRHKSVATRSPYEVLGVAANATAEQIRQAHLLRSKLLHPDRFDQARHREEWNLANELLKELNTAYDALRDPASRARHDRASFR